MVCNIDFTKSIYCIITGASRGIGRTIAVELAGRATNSLTLVLLARSERDLIETGTLAKKVNENVEVICKAVNLVSADFDTYERLLIETYEKSQPDIAIIFHNAGQIGFVKKTVDLTDADFWTDYYKLNLISVALLNAAFVKTAKGNASKLLSVNITSLVGRKPFKYLSMYGSAKAARDMYFKVLAKEEPDIAVLNYSPGMVQTSMANEVLTNMKHFEDSEIKPGGGMLTSEQTVNKMMTLLEKAEYTSGDIIDYYD